jgi:threonine aldolase
MKITRNFASDNNSGILPEVLEAIGRANVGHTVAYGADAVTESAMKKFKEHFGQNIEVAFVFNGTAANVLSIQALTKAYHAVICSDVAHINNDECGAPEKLTGCKLLSVATTDGKLSVESIRSQLKGFDDQHHVQPKVISITQATEMGTVYLPEEVRAIAKLAHDHGMYLHMDGARIANAAASLGLSLKAATVDLGVDVLSFGGTKNGLMLGEAVVFFRPELAKDFKFIRKQGMQLSSKMRFIAAQFEALLSDDVWLKSATHSNRLAKILEAEIRKIPGLEITQKVDANGVFVRIPRKIVAPLQEKSFFYVWNDSGANPEVRWMTSFDTTEQDIREFASHVAQVLTAFN